jgi:general secretion pathway protein B
MSTILDALKKSERERTVLRGLGFSDAGWHPARDIDWLRWTIIGGLLAIAAIATGVFVFRARIVPMQVETPVVQNAAPSSTTDTVASSNPVPKSALPATPETVAPAKPLTPPPLMEAAAEPLPPALPLAAPGPDAEFLGSMAPEFQQTVPPMTVNVHVYAADESRRILYINNRPYGRGDEIPGGVRVEEIVPEGVVLQFHGQRFKLARPS